MTINVHKETLIGMSESKCLPTEPSRTTVYFWCDNGIKNRITGQMCVLETVLVGGRRFTSLEAYDRWQEKLNAGRET